jgi:hypothetical protein
VAAADVVIPSGYLIDEWILAGVIHVNSSRTRFVKVVQGKPDKTTWLQWRRLMQLVGDELIQCPLGEWLHPAPGLRRLWPYYIDLRLKFLYVQGATGFVQYAKTRSGDYAHGLVIESWTPTESCVPVKADPSGRGAYFLNNESLHRAVSSPVPPVAQTFLEYIDDLPEWDRSLFQPVASATGGPF